MGRTRLRGVATKSYMCIHDVVHVYIHVHLAFTVGREAVSGAGWYRFRYKWHLGPRTFTCTCTCIVQPGGLDNTVIYCVCIPRYY